MYSRNSMCLLVGIALICLGSSGQGDIFNGSFELSDPINSFGVKPPTGWQSKHYTNTISRLERDLIVGDPNNWDSDILENGLEPYDGDCLVLLSTGSNVEIDRIGYATLSQKITIAGGERISGAFFFGTCDYFPYDDYAQIQLLADPNTMVDPNNIMLVNTSITILGRGDYASAEGWEYFEYDFSQHQAGEYTLEIGVYDKIDLVLNSYLAVDALKICENPGKSDINHDCNIDLQDFGLLASDWLKNCSDPNESCHPQTNLIGNNFINLEDLNFFLSDWGFWEQ